MDKEILDLLKKMDSKFDKMDSRFDKIESRLDKMDSRLDKMDSRFDKIEVTLGEHGEFLKALIHNSEVNKAEHDKMSNDIAHIKGDVEAIKTDFAIVEKVTIKNWNDISELKAIR